MKVWTIMTAMPPTKGHNDLINFCRQLCDVNLILCTQSHEPMVSERAEWAKGKMGPQDTFHHMKATIEQDPSTPGFRNMWRAILQNFGFQNGDIFVASETYGSWIAQESGGIFYPYDIDRLIGFTKASDVRNKVLGFQYFTQIDIDFQKYFRPIVTMFGAESVGKTTIAKKVARDAFGRYIHEFARPFLENNPNVIDVNSMTHIWNGQAALQLHAQDNLHDKRFIVQDTDLFSTVGYWGLPHWQDKLGPVPDQLIDNAQELKSDLYIILSSNIPFEADPLRYGGDKRESSDQYWIDLCKKHNLSYVVLSNPNEKNRIDDSISCLRELIKEKFAKIHYDRGGF